MKKLKKLITCSSILFLCGCTHDNAYLSPTSAETHRDIHRTPPTTQLRFLLQYKTGSAPPVSPSNNQKTHRRDTISWVKAVCRVINSGEKLSHKNNSSKPAPNMWHQYGIGGSAREMYFCCGKDTLYVS